MKFIVRHWSSLLPDDCRAIDGLPRWVDYSVHPPSKLGLHNALLAVHDRVEILQAHGGRSGCEVVVVEGEQTEKLSQEDANALFSRLPRGEVKWLDIHDFILPAHPAVSSSMKQCDGAPVAEQLPLFEHTPTPYDELDVKPHILDVDA